MNIHINRDLVIPSNEIKWRFSRSSGPGGQNVNKVESRVEIIFNISQSNALNSFQKGLLLEKLNNKISNDSISIKVQEKRTQFENRQIAIQKLITLLKKQLMSDTRARQETKPTKASQKRRIDSKKKRGEIKRNRQKISNKDL